MEYRDKGKWEGILLALING